MDAISEARLQLVASPLADKIRTLANLMENRGQYIRVVQAQRSWSEQDALYAQGRSTSGKIVTNCQGGYSYHNFGMAVDCVPSQYAEDQPFNPDWNSSHPVWKEMESLGQSLGLDSGAIWRTFPDAPHFQLTGIFPEGAPTDEVRQIFRDSGIEEVWRQSGIIVPTIES